MLTAAEGLSSGLCLRGHVCQHLGACAHVCPPACARARTCHPAALCPCLCLAASACGACHMTESAGRGVPGCPFVCVSSHSDGCLSVLSALRAGHCVCCCPQPSPVVEEKVTVGGASVHTAGPRSGAGLPRGAQAAVSVCSRAVSVLGSPTSLGRALLPVPVMPRWWLASHSWGVGGSCCGHAQHCPTGAGRQRGWPWIPSPAWLRGSSAPKPGALVSP